MNAGLYVHVPFCARRCSYCDFYALVADSGVHDRWVDAVLREAEIRAGAWANQRFDSAFFGGGTPTHLGPARIRRLFQGLRARLPIERDAEWTIEANPESADDALLAAALEGGANRISIGLQSLEDGELRTLGRLHSADAGREAVRRARSAGFDNIGVDLIYGLPVAEAPRAWDASLQGAIGLSPEHISCYLLTLEPEVPMARAVDLREIHLPGESTEVAEYGRARELLAAAGYERYEISNWARPGFRCLHNENVWQGGAYLGLGPGAHGFDGAFRRANAADLGGYIEAIEAGGDAPHTEEKIEGRARDEERIFLGLRRRDGVAWEELEGSLGAEGTGRLRARALRWMTRGYLVDEEGRLRLGDAGLMISNALIADLLDAI
jgi:oxygen-independent coproporphyrinogen III oxidase